MPILLPPLNNSVNRREWMTAALAAGAGVLSEETGAAEAADMWVLFSDTHIPDHPGVESRGVNMTANLRRCVNQVLALKQKPFGVLVNGDCAFLSGQVGDYALFGESITPLREASLPVYCALGNHDDRKNFLAALTSSEERRPLEDKHVTAIHGARVNWVLLDSLDKVNKTPGLLGEPQLGWLERTLRELPEKPTFVVAHHNPQPAVKEGEKLFGMLDSEAMFAVLARHKKVRAFICGHSHVWEHVKHEATGLDVLNLPPVAYVFDAARPSGWVLARARDGAMEFELRSLNPNHDQHRQIVKIPFAAA